MIIRDKDGSYRWPKVKGQFEPRASEEPDQDDQGSEEEGGFLADEGGEERSINHGSHASEPGSTQGE